LSYMFFFKVFSHLQNKSLRFFVLISIVVDIPVSV